MNLLMNLPKKLPRINSLSLAALAGIAIITPAFATVTIDYVYVGNAGNAADTSGYGAVAYAYNIGKYEVTNAQYGEFLNAKGASNSDGIYNSNMAAYGITQNGISGSFTYSVTGALANHPVVWVSWYDAARFANWMLNGQGSGDMTEGAYELIGNTGIIAVNPGAQIHLPSEDEWYKAAYYNKGDKPGYWLYTNGQNSITTADANYDFITGGTTDVGTYSGDPSPYGTFDQGGNVWEWNDAVIFGSDRGLRGGSYYNADSNLASSFRDNAGPLFEDLATGFRLVSSVPEPTSLVLTMLAGSMMLIRRKR